MRSTVCRTVAAAIILMVFAAVPAGAQAPKGCGTLVGSLAAQVDREQGWVGQGYLAIDGAEPIAAELVDRPLGPPRTTAQGMWGTEELTFTQKGPGDVVLGTLVMRVDFLGMATPAPFMAQYHATGKLTGSGIYADATGSVTIQGSAIADPMNVPPRVWPFVWMAEIHGSICGVK